MLTCLSHQLSRRGYPHVDLPVTRHGYSGRRVTLNSRCIGCRVLRGGHSVTDIQQLSRRGYPHVDLPVTRHGYSGRRVTLNSRCIGCRVLRGGHSLTDIQQLSRRVTRMLTCLSHARL
ncbi:hypothetical protein J6590_069107 [Homalodisca vitripennis]|nr:hypothetical protein J6590_069107 [Homalodisca vitripennis]